MPNIKIDFKSLFYLLTDKKYCVIKLPDDFPEYMIGSDLDIFCYDIEDVAKIILGFLPKELVVRVTNKIKQIYIDIMDGSDIHFRFDLYNALPVYENVLIKEAFFSSVIENVRFIDQNGCKVKVPSCMDENILRYIEYQEWYGKRPDKLKHIEYIQDKITSDAISLNDIMDKLHFYTALPLCSSDKVSKSRFSSHMVTKLAVFKKVMASIKVEGFKRTCILIFKKLKK